ncbi:MAG: putative UDP-N-acetylmuramoylalanyl-D-glutamyl-2,6-diaminopimelate--D-alanyl-D-alanine ligase [Chlamydiota bacterium]|jgi:UDP-N-acetylmuramoyl-tripeptide--D-alanyl-D-alanine ligase
MQLDDIPEGVVHFCQDSRLAQPGSLFFALKGGRVDGHSYLQEVANRGAIGAVVESFYQGPDYGLHLIRVDDVLGALQQLARQKCNREGYKIVGVTGSVGKTTTKEFIVTLLEEKYRVGKSAGNANSQVGLPLTLLNAKGNEEIFVLEMGMSEAGQIKKLVSIAPPDIAVVTKIAPCHALFFKDGLEGIARAKAEILTCAQVAILNDQVLQFKAFQHLGCRLVSYGKHIFHEVSAIPRHLMENVEGAVAVALECGMTEQEIAVRLPLLKGCSKRFEKIEKRGVVWINDAYNANPISMKGALSSLPKDLGRKIAVFGSMKELGAYEESGHREVGEEARATVDLLFCLGQECGPMVEAFAEGGKPVEHFLEFEALQKRLFEMVRKGDVVLLKGANSHQLWRLCEAF